jgi:hypothetical protein
MCGPINKQEHLHGDWRVSGDREKLPRPRRCSPFLPIANANLLCSHLYGLINLTSPGGFALDLERFGRQIRSGMKS